LTFSIGDGHGAQDDGEVCVTAVETGLVVPRRHWWHFTNIVVLGSDRLTRCVLRKLEGAVPTL
jgi:hypothetical protein